MDLKKVTSTESLLQPNSGLGKVTPDKGGPSFGDMLGKIQNQMPTAVGQMPAGVKAPQMPNAADAVKFSNHAVERMQTRGISFNKADMERLGEAVQRAASKGSRDTLVLMNDSALIVSVKNKTVVTVMDKAALKENVFTNIDSTIVM